MRMRKTNHSQRKKRMKKATANECQAKCTRKIFVDFDCPFSYLN